ncbi:hypothetical protein HNQ59_001180 [Chitinivorax tropicus]|uniref:Transcription factor zinc-finger domain-containing protein n=1 Tax=Chitinivorax tropicus TaxID=714531 RepID=A0A840MHN8_9PROT|nr:zf-TFIIB domain-containing protein [Chitinivorax tropicus]MBB5017910.1 hypothetical protein [Chitinivorax tropicus]
MKCPVCEGVNLVMSERSGVEIDYCPQCRGVWLDRGELDKIIDRSAVQTSAQPAAYEASHELPRGHGQPSSSHPQYSQHQHQSYQQQHQQHQQQHHHDSGYYKKKKREGFLGELFDFD